MILEGLDSVGAQHFSGGVVLLEVLCLRISVGRLGVGQVGERVMLPERRRATEP